MKEEYFLEVKVYWSFHSDKVYWSFLFWNDKSEYNVITIFECKIQFKIVP